MAFTGRDGEGAMANSCEGYDNTLPLQLREEIRKYLRATGAPKFKARTGRERVFLDDDEACLIEDFGANWCGSGNCTHKGQAIENYTPKQRLTDPISS
jgi:hypothetical protein